MTQDSNVRPIIIEGKQWFTAGGEHSTRFMYNEIFKHEIYTHHLCQVEKGDIVIDIGANVGFFTTQAIQKGAKGVFAFEPDPSTFRALQHNCKDTHHSELIQQALANRNGEVIFHSFNKRKGSCTIMDERASTIKDYSVSYPIKTRTLDSTFKLNDNSVKSLFIKIDTEGAEELIIEGGRQIIKRYIPKVAIASYHLPNESQRLIKLFNEIDSRYVHTITITPDGEEVTFFWVPPLFKRLKVEPLVDHLEEQRQAIKKAELALMYGGFHPLENLKDIRTQLQGGAFV